MCDFHLNYAGCRNMNQFAFADVILIALHAISIILYGFYLLRRYFTDKNGGFKDMDLIAVLALLYASIRIIFLSHIRSIINFDLKNTTTEQLQLHVAGNIYIDLVVWIFAGLTTNALVKAMITACSGTNLYDPIKINGKKVDPTKALKIYRVVVLIINTVAFVLFAAKGVYGTKQEYVLLRRFPYIWVSILSFIISPFQLYFFGSKVLLALQSTEKSSGSSSANNVAVSTIQQSKSGPTADSHIKKLENNSKQDKLTQIIWFLKMNIYSVILFLYWPSAFYLTFYWAVNETVADQSILFNVKVATDALLWLNTTFFAGFLLQRLPPLFKVGASN
ncbi:hypothetical protein BC833DRAFT_612544 [Globomyces pollinis-pini]|nr:hypothetical protein BC833DRAFT_612544 [Globomyces pollinis-pini]